MAKKYTIDYTHTTGTRSKQTTSITQLFEWLETALNDRHIVESSIVINTEEKK